MTIACPVDRSPCADCTTICQLDGMSILTGAEVRQEPAVLELSLDGVDEPIVVGPGSEVILGRDPDLSPHAASLARFDNVSRRHAVLGMDEDGAAWIRDEGSRNGTWLGDNELAPRVKSTLDDGARIRLAADHHGTVRITRERP